MSEAFEVWLSDGKAFRGRATARLARGEVFVDDLAGASIARLPVTRIRELEVDASPPMKGRHRHRTGMNVTLRPVDGPLVRLHPATSASFGGATVVFQALKGDPAAVEALNERAEGPAAYRRFVLDLAREVKARGGRVTVGKRGHVVSPLVAALFVLAGAGLIGWQASEPKTFAIYALGGAMLAGGIAMFLRAPGARPREVDGSEASLAAYLPGPPA